MGRSFGTFLGAADDLMATFSAPMDVLFHIIVETQYLPSLHYWKGYMSIDTDDDKRRRMFGHPLDAPESQS